MKQFEFRRASRLRASLAAALIACAAPAATFAKDKTEAFVAGAQIVEEVVPGSPDRDCQPTTEQPGATAQGTISGSGLGTSIGAFTVSSVDCLRSMNPAWPTPPFTFNSTSLKLTATNGNQLFARYSGTAELNTSGLLVLDGVFTITGGTGQFNNATGSGTVKGVEDISTFPARGFVTLVGQISR